MLRDFLKYENTLSTNSLSRLLSFSPFLLLFVSDMVIGQVTAEIDVKNTPQLSNSADHTAHVHSNKCNDKLNAFANSSPGPLGWGRFSCRCFMVPYERNLRKNPECLFVKGMHWKG
jgi:hypothetical protein